ncbi:hypothetical protein FGO68_gene11403 [Halteria grandinella]|uniref:Uncharacterized protein n=1 Tax=Halteria grandinella TaxID=5974 RepID=A0A8J8SVK1_HALGN|nr:hypothetical protein FGO68_gene11403 [Halteria grandinella]
MLQLYKVILQLNHCLLKKYKQPFIKACVKSFIALIPLVLWSLYFPKICGIARKRYYSEKPKALYHNSILLTYGQFLTKMYNRDISTSVATTIGENIEIHIYGEKFY